MTFFGLLLVALLGAIVVIASLRPSAFRIAREIVIAAPPEAVFAQLDDFRRWNAWSPWMKRDPGLAITYEGPESGVGASAAWSSVTSGIGRLAITECVRDERLRVTLDQPTKRAKKMAFDLEPLGGGTHVVWSMNGECDFFAKLFGLFVNLDKRIGGDFEGGLADLRASVERKRQE